ncbi:MAG: DegT/DnrJ/EryC1/StrS family aminotransferase [Kiritimatiellaeota bacterium]|nr:DegT/DnrJ/EryC1/StrS family aminotransferase [Kiritimatiellota bacterium]
MSERVFLSPPWMGGNEREMVEAAFASNYIAPCGPMVDAFEEAFAQSVALPHACALSSCSAALDLLFHELNIQKGDRVFCSDLTFVASVASAVRRGAEPVFIDCDKTSWTMDPDLLGEALADARRDNRLPKAVIAVDLYGQCCDYGRIENLCAEHGVPLIIDAAEAVGATYKGRPAGNAGLAAVYSFNGNKIITTSGGGMLASRDASLVARATKRAQQSREPKVWYEHEELGYNYRMSNILAAIGIAQLRMLPEIVRRKRQIFARYGERLRDHPEIRFMPEASYGEPTRWLTVAQIEAHDPNLLIQTLEGANIESRPIWKPMHLQPVFRGARVYGGAIGERLFKTGLCLPSGAGLSTFDIDRICAILKDCLR